MIIRDSSVLMGFFFQKSIYKISLVLMISYLSRKGTRCPCVVVVVENCRITRVTVMSQSSSLQTSQLADDTVSGLLSPKLTGIPFISPSSELQLLLPQPR